MNYLGFLIFLAILMAPLVASLQGRDATVSDSGLNYSESDSMMVSEGGAGSDRLYKSAKRREIQSPGEDLSERYDRDPASVDQFDNLEKLSTDEEIKSELDSKKASDLPLNSMLNILPFNYIEGNDDPTQFNVHAFQKFISQPGNLIGLMDGASASSNKNQKSPSLQLIQDALSHASQQLHEIRARNREEKQKNESYFVQPELQSPYNSSGLYSKYLTGDGSRLRELAGQYLRQRLGETLGIVPEHVLRPAIDTSIEIEATEVCPSILPITCLESKYQSFDGTCNNLENPTWGSAGTCQLRLLPAVYSDGISHPRTIGENGKPLLSGREISRKIVCQKEGNSPIFNMWWISVGQLLAHDNSNTPLGVPVDCCANPDPFECINFYYGPNDPLSADGPCFALPRTVPCPQCEIGPRIPITLNSAFHDLNVIYGSSEAVSLSLRLLEKGYLKYSLDPNGKMILPEAPPGLVQCTSILCVLAGEFRASQNPNILSIYIIILRFHNYMAEKLYQEHPSWSDEILFQEARKRVIMHWQRVIYEEYLSPVIGPEYMSYFRLNDLTTEYDSSINPGSLVEVSTAAARAAHSSIKSHYKLAGTREQLRLKEQYLQANLQFEGKADSLGLGQLEQPSAKLDRCETVDIKLNTYWTQFFGLRQYGFDLAALDIERGRDHGLAPYYAYVALCSGKKLETWKDLKLFIDGKGIKKLKSTYSSVKDVDLWIGGLLEEKLPGAVVGPTFACLLGLQYHNLKYGDRFFYTHYDRREYFTAGQDLSQAFSKAFHDILCATMELASVQEKAMELESWSNPQLSCIFSRNATIF